MNTVGLLSDQHHPLVESTALRLTSSKNDPVEKLEAIFYFVRDEIQFGFPPKWDRVKASETLQYKKGYCNTKATLLAALCNVAGIPARIHTGLIDIQIMRGIIPSFAFPFLPRAGGHSWMEIKIGNEWMPVDSYINDKPFYDRALRRLLQSGKKTAFSISHAKGESSCEFNLGQKRFVHTGAVVEDHGIWGDFSEYMASNKYLGPNLLQKTVYPLIAWMSNRNIEKIRQSEM